MSFGLNNALVTFQRVIDTLLSSVNLQFAYDYLDDIVIYSRTSREHINYIELALSHSKEAGVCSKLETSALLMKKIDYFCDIIRPRQLEVAAHTPDALHDLKKSTTQIELHSFLGFCNVFLRRFPKSAYIAAPLAARLQKDQAKALGQLNDEELTAFHTLQEKLTSSPILALQERKDIYARHRRLRPKD